MASEGPVRLLDLMYYSYSGAYAVEPTKRVELRHFQACPGKTL